MFPKIYLAAALVLFTQGNAQAAESRIPAPDDFAASFSVTGVEGSLMRLELPEAVYSMVERPDLGDIRVFDAEGTPVPFLVRPPPEQRYDPPAEALPFFFWSAGEPPKPADMEINAAGALIRVFNAARPAELPERSIILDLKELSYAPSRLRFELASGDFNSAVELRGSEDLTVWKSLGRQTLARYGASLEQLVLELPAASAYLLIRPEKPLPEILSLSAEFNTISLPEKIRESRFPPRGGGRELVYDTGGFYPLCSIDLLLSEADFYDVRIESRSYEDEPWRYESSGPVYRFNEHDTARRNRAFELDRPARYWRVSASGEAPFTSAPALVLRWEPRELIFLGRGRGPWTLACGNRDFEPVQGMLSLSGGETLSAAEAGGLRYTQRQTTLKKNSLYQVWILWGSLIFSALVLTALALYIARSMNKQKER